MFRLTPAVTGQDLPSLTILRQFSTSIYRCSTETVKLSVQLVTFLPLSLPIIRSGTDYSKKIRLEIKLPLLSPVKFAGLSARKEHLKRFHISAAQPAGRVVLLRRACLIFSCQNGYDSEDIFFGDWCAPMHRIQLLRARPDQGDLRLSGPLSGQGASDEARTRDRRVPANLRADSLATVPQMTDCSV
ncbi:hypothetical protein PoB_000551700 [Plakobranchus ocellatus]|uniref:Uncharacterized protein n=1 Tax=Plakobranchus ocellatus TaxID=259542 RepID=A0AAV3YA81_9GAST|nr:hypothetical protein PoB_000551700 [Plakobranchus ocellatus]